MRTWSTPANAELGTAQSQLGLFYFSKLRSCKSAPSPCMFMPTYFVGPNRIFDPNFLLARVLNLHDNLFQAEHLDLSLTL